jgi:hypothetical protein
MLLIIWNTDTAEGGCATFEIKIYSFCGTAALGCGLALLFSLSSERLWPLRAEICHHACNAKAGKEIRW